MAGVLNATEPVAPQGDELLSAATAGSAHTAPSRANGPARFALPANADIRMATELLALCRAALDAEGDVVLDCADVERVDAAALQCLVALHASLTGAGRSLTVSTPTAVFCAAVEVLGLEQLLDGVAGDRECP